MKPLIELDRVDVILNRQPVLHGVSLSIREGERWAVLGGNGSGKTTLLRLLRGNQWPASESPGRRLYHFNGEVQESPIGVREQIGFVSAEEQERLLRRRPPQSAREVIQCGFFDTPYLQETLNVEQKRRFEEVVARTGTRPLLDNLITELSQGELRKVLIARALVPWPRMLLLDEVCNGLDSSARAEILGLVGELAAEGLTLVMTSHRPEELLENLTHAAVLRDGEVIKTGEAAEVLPRREKFSGDCATSALHQGAFSSTKPVISIRTADVFAGRTKILHNLNVEIKEGENWAVLGGNGSGKTTFLRLLYGDYFPALGGTIRRFDLPARASLWDIRRRFGYVGEELHAAYHPNLRTIDVVLSGFYSSVGLYDWPTEQQRETARAWLRFFGLEERCEQHLHTLSHGQFRRALFARALVHRPRMLLLDEPFNGLDQESRLLVQQKLSDLIRRETQVILTTHHEEDVLPEINSVIRMEEGRVVNA